MRVNDFHSQRGVHWQITFESKPRFLLSNAFFWKYALRLRNFGKAY